MARRIKSIRTTSSKSDKTLASVSRDVEKSFDAPQKTFGGKIIKREDNEGVPVYTFYCWLKGRPEPGGFDEACAYWNESLGLSFSQLRALALAKAKELRQHVQNLPE